MTDTNQQLIDTFDQRFERRNDRREFFKAAMGAAAVAGAGVAAVSLGGVATAQTLTDADFLNFALNLEYLEAQFYSYAAFGTGLPANKLDGTVGTPGAVTGGAQVPFSDAAVRAYAREIAADEIAHVDFLRSQLGTSRIAQPAIDIGTSPTSAFSNAARAAGLIGAGASFNPYADDNSFLLGAFLFEDVGVTAYKGAAPLLRNDSPAAKALLEATAGILAVEAYHAAIIRTTLYAKGLLTQADAISNARDNLDGTGTGQDIDQGISPSQGLPVTSGATAAANIAPLDSTGRAFSRTTGQVLNVLYLNAASATSGGFFPNGVNGAIRTSAASNTPTV